MALASRVANGPAWRGHARRIGVRSGAIVGALGILAGVLMLGFALASYHPSDPALMTAAGGPPRNLLGAPGAWIADLLLTVFGLSSALLLPPLVVVALRLWRGVEPGKWKRALPITLLAMILCDIMLALLRGTAMQLLSRDVESTVVIDTAMRTIELMSGAGPGPATAPEPG